MRSEFQDAMPRATLLPLAKNPPYSSGTRRQGQDNILSMGRDLRGLDVQDQKGMDKDTSQPHVQKLDWLHIVRGRKQTLS